MRLDTGADIAALAELDPKLWVALSCPASGLEFDEKTLAMLDTDADGRVRAREILDAVAFLRTNLRDLDGLLAGTDAVRLDRFVADAPLATSARRILATLGKPDATELTLADAEGAAGLLAATAFNGDGVITATAAASDPALASALTDAITTVGGVPDRDGQPGLSRDAITKFFDELAATEQWLATVNAENHPLGPATPAAQTAIDAVQVKIDDYFTRCRLAAYDPRATLDHDPAAFAARGASDLSANAAEFASLPIARVEAGRPLPLTDGVHPYWADAIATLREAALRPLIGDVQSLSAADWAATQAKLAAYRGWLAQKPASTADALGRARIAELLGSSAKGGLMSLIDTDLGFTADWEALVALERLVRYHRDLLALLRNFVSFEDFYAPGRKSVFQAGRMFLDGRSCDLVFRVDDAGRHAALAGLARCYLAYCTATRAGEAPRQIVAVFSSGDSDFLMVGRNGVFYDRDDRDWDVTVTRVVENPIGLREAFFAPYKRLLRVVEDQIGARAAAASGDVDASLAASPAKAPSLDLSSIALIGVAVSGAAAVLGGLLDALLGLGLWMPLGLAGLVLAVSGPSMVVAALKLRQRNLGPILEANGWAINGRVKINIPFGESLTQLAQLPSGAQTSFVDPYQPRRSAWVPLFWLAVATAVPFGSVLLAYHQGAIPRPFETKLGFFGVPRHLSLEKDAAHAAVDEAKLVLTSAQEQATAAKAAVDALTAAAEPPGPRLERAQSRLARAEAKLARAEDKLDVCEGRLEAATEALEVAEDRHEARAEAAEAAAAPK